MGLLASAACGCAGPLGEAGGAGAQRSSSAQPAPADPVAAFAAAAVPGSETVAAVPEMGGSARLRLVRAYTAASGRECREVLMGSGLGERSRLLCRGEGGWVPARPLLSGGGARP